MSFKQFLNEELSIKAPRPIKTNITLNLSEYGDTIKESIMNGKKTILNRLENKGEIPVFCEEAQKFFMVELNRKKLKARELKNREDKELSGVLFNSMILKEYKKGNEEKIKFLTEMKLSWDVPEIIFMTKDEFGKNVSIKKL